MAVEVQTVFAQLSLTTFGDLIDSVWYNANNKRISIWHIRAQVL